MINIDLTKSERGQVNLLTDIHQKLPQHRSWLGFNKTTMCTLSIRVVELSYSGLIVRNPENLIMIKIKDKEDSNIVLDIDSQDWTFSTLLDTNEILDCEEMETRNNVDRDYIIKYKIEYEILSEKHPSPKRVMDAADKRKEAVFEHKVRFAKIQQSVRIDYDEQSIEFSLAQNESVACGFLDLSLAHTCKRAPYLNMEFTLSVLQPTSLGEINRSDIALIDMNDISEINGLAQSGDMNLAIEGASSTRLISQYDPLTKKYSICNFYVNGSDHHVLLPIKWNLSAINNPIEESELYHLVIEGYMWSGDDESSKTELPFWKKRVTILRNTKKTDLRVSVDIPTATADFEKNRLVLINDQDNEPVVYAKDFVAREILVNDDTNREFYLVIGNTAEAPSVEGAAIRVRNFSISGPTYNEGIKVINKNDAISPFELLSNGLFEFPQDITSLIYGKENKLRIRYKGGSITGFTLNNTICFETEARFNFSFQYIVDSDGTKSNPTESDFTRFIGCLVFPLSVAPKPEWMCIDFGTSAVVAEYGKSLYNERGDLANNLIDLRAKKKELLRKAYGDKEKSQREDKSETNTEFISSMCGFNWLAKDLSHYNIVRKKQEFSESAIWFSPSTGMIQPNYQLPCLKSLMGYESLPKGIFPADFEKELFSSPASKVDEIYKVIYKQLFTYYVPKDIEQLVLSIPNTFAPIHVETLRKIAIECIDNLRPSRIRFVSESDAVAYHYISRRESIMESGGIRHRDWDKSDQDVLVYDMGAGTLDLTYFHKTHGNNTVIEIKGKMGVNKAGNYIDYLIAEILADILFQNGKTKQSEQIFQLLELNRDKRNAAIQNSKCNALKTYVRDLVKPLLNAPETKLPKLVDVEDGIDLTVYTCQNILEHPKFQGFIHDITHGVFNHFASMFGENGKLPLNLVIFSGRSTSLQIIRDSIIDSISAFNTNETCRFIDIATEKFVNKGDAISKESIKGLKSVVAAGSLAYPLVVKDENAAQRAYIVKNKNVYATYGIMAHSTSGWIWLPLINNKTIPTELPKSIHGLDIYCYDSSKYCVAGKNIVNKLPLGSIDCLYVLQTYSSHPLEDWKAGNKEMTTILLYKGNLGNYTTDQDVALKINEKNEIVLWIGDSSTGMLAHDDFYNTSFRKGMWPVIFSETQNEA